MIEDRMKKVPIVREKKYFARGILTLSLFQELGHPDALVGK